MGVTIFAVTVIFSGSLFSGGASGCGGATSSESTDADDSSQGDSGDTGDDSADSPMDSEITGCSETCSKIYDQCLLEFTGLSASECETACNNGLIGSQEIVDCYRTANCAVECMQGCPSPASDCADPESTSVIPATKYITTSSIWEISDSGETIELLDGSIWDVTFESFRSSIWLEASRVVVCNNVMVNLSQGNGVSVSLVNGAYYQCSEFSAFFSDAQYSISSKELSTVTLDDGSIWNITSGSAIGWLTGDVIVVTIWGDIVNIDTKESVRGSRIN